MFMSFFSIAQGEKKEQEITKVLDIFHQAAAQANAQVYLNLLTDDAIFLGTDASERWNKKQFTDFVLPNFDNGNGWLYVAKERNISLLENHTAAFFDEILENDKYGRCRGTGVVIQTDQGWGISQYSLSVMVPNGIAKKVVDEIKNYEQKK